jgi:mono/diheme cytochrome c family protein
MTRHAWLASLAIAVTSTAAIPHSAIAQQLDETQVLGRRLFAQSCGVCHVNVQRTSALYGPALSQESLGGQADVMREVIANGTPRMPGFRHHFETREIDAIVAYIKTVPAPPAPQPAQARP